MIPRQLFPLCLLDSPCEEGAVYLVSGHNAREGRVQVCYSGEWHSICSDNWRETEADVVCTSLGYSAELGEGSVE